MENKKRKFNLSKMLSSILYFALGIYAGFHMVVLPYYNNIILVYTVGIICLFLAFTITTIVHEAGHLVFGSITGYKLSSFRIMNFIWIKENGKIKLRRYSLAGTGGQCLMSPPDMVDGKIPVVLYNLGGSLMNLVASILFFILSNVIDIPTIFCFLRITMAFGIVFALTNGIPMRGHMLGNDGYNAISLRNNEKALRAFWVRLKVNSLLAEGYRVKDMPDDLFILQSEEDMQNSMVSITSMLCGVRLMDEHRFEEADALYKRLIDANVLIGAHRCLAVCDRICCEIITENRVEPICEMLTKEQKKLMRAMRKSETVLRTEYLLASFYEYNSEKAKKIKKQFEHKAKNHPYPSDIESERELILIAEERHRINNNEK